MKSEIFLNVRPYQTRIALVKAGVLKTSPITLLGLPPWWVLSIRLSTQNRFCFEFAFIDIGHKKACFLYGKDLLEKSGMLVMS